MIYLQLAFTEGNTFRGCLSVPKTFSHSSFDNGWLKSQETDIGRGIDLSLRWFITEDLKHIGDLRHDCASESEDVDVDVASIGCDTF